MEFKFRYLWIFPYAVLTSLPYFVSDVWYTFTHLYNNVGLETAFLCEEYATESEDESESGTESSEKED